MGVRSRRSNKKRRRAATVSVGDGGGDGVDSLPSAAHTVSSRTMGVRSRRSNKKRRRAATVSVDDGGDGVDLISGLNDDLLLRILELVPNAENVVRTHALSRRWRGLWTGVAALRFDYNSGRKSCRSNAAAKRFIALVNGALELRAAAAKEPAFVEDLAISFDLSEQETEQLVPHSVEAAQGWIRYALQHKVKSLIVKLEFPWLPRLQRMSEGRNAYDIELPVVSLDEIDSYAKMETMHLRLGGAELRLPSSMVVFSSLVDLSLEDIKVPCGYLFSRLVSSACCPHLHKLQLRLSSFEPSTMEVLLLIESDALLELSLECLFRLQFLELRTPSLQVLHIDDNNLFYLNGVTVSAPRLETHILGTTIFAY